MRKIVVLLLLSLVFSGQSAQAQKSVSKMKKEGWNLTWQEKFSGSKIDWDSWGKTPRAGSDWSNFMGDYEDLYEVKSGRLILWGKRNELHKEDPVEFLTGGISTKGHKYFPNGRIEIRARGDQAKGFWPAIWMLPRDAKWPMGGEIDIMEHLNFDEEVYQTIHTNYTYNLKQMTPKHFNVTKVDFEEWNVYAVERYQDSLCFFVNDKLSHVYKRIETDLPGQFPFPDEPYYLILSSQLGGNWVGDIDPEQLPVKMEVDWVRFYEKEE